MKEGGGEERGEGGRKEEGGGRGRRESERREEGTGGGREGGGERASEVNRGKSCEERLVRCVMQRYGCVVL